MWFKCARILRRGPFAIPFYLGARRRLLPIRLTVRQFIRDNFSECENGRLITPRGGLRRRARDRTAPRPLASASSLARPRVVDKNISGTLSGRPPTASGRYPDCLQQLLDFPKQPPDRLRLPRLRRHFLAPAFRVILPPRAPRPGPSPAPGDPMLPTARKLAFTDVPVVDFEPLWSGGAGGSGRRRRDRGGLRPGRLLLRQAPRHQRSRRLRHLPDLGRLPQSAARRQDGSFDDQERSCPGLPARHDQRQR